MPKDLNDDGRRDLMNVEHKWTRANMRWAFFKPEIDWLASMCNHSSHEPFLSWKSCEFFITDLACKKKGGNQHMHIH